MLQEVVTASERLSSRFVTMSSLQTTRGNGIDPLKSCVVALRGFKHFLAFILLMFSPLPLQPCTAILATRHVAFVMRRAKLYGMLAL